MNHIFMPEEREAVLECLAMIADVNGGRLTPADVVKEARDPNSSLNRYFDFEDDTWQAKQ